MDDASARANASVRTEEYGDGADAVRRRLVGVPDRHPTGPTARASIVRTPSTPPKPTAVQPSMSPAVSRPAALATATPAGIAAVVGGGNVTT